MKIKECGEVVKLIAYYIVFLIIFHYNNLKHNK